MKKFLLFTSIILLTLIFVITVCVIVVKESIIHVELPHGAILYVLPYHRNNQVEGAVIICPGGGYSYFFYPVISMKKDLTHIDSHNQLLGEDASEELEDLYSNEFHISSKTPPIFISVTSDDKAVSPQNSILF